MRKNMQLSVKTGAATQVSTDTLALPMLLQDSTTPTLPRALVALDRTLGGAIAAVLRSGDFRGRSDEFQLIYPSADSKVRRVMLMGLGDPKKVDAETLRRLAGTSVRSATAKGARSLSIVVPRLRRIKTSESSGALAEGATLGSYRFDTYRPKSDDRSSKLRSLGLVYESIGDLRATRAAARDAIAVAEAQNLARQLSNEPANKLPPAGLASEARKMARKTGLKCRVLGEADLKRHGMGGILAVGQGSANTPRLIVLEHSGSARGTKSRLSSPICLVGKGITFDSGGISIKPATGMQDMKHDMSGAASVIGALQAAARLKLPQRVVGIVAAAENMPGPTAYRPGDIVTTYSGKTIEVLNTDAEGRIVLADAITYANRQYSPQAIVDVATLTGAMMVALGSWATGVFTNNESLCEAINKAGKATGELAWPMPLLDGHRKAMKSPIADLRNTGGRNAGASTAAAFLWEFAGDTPWAHLDIAGTGWTEKAAAYQPRGATGVAVRLLARLLRDWDPNRDI
jgi:leucyl aminopeptidase